MSHSHINWQDQSQSMKMVEYHLRSVHASLTSRVTPLARAIPRQGSRSHALPPRARESGGGGGSARGARLGFPGDVVAEDALLVQLAARIGGVPDRAVRGLKPPNPFPSSRSSLQGGAASVACWGSAPATLLREQQSCRVSGA